MNKIFVIASRVPYPLDKGDKLRIYHQVKELSRHFDVCLCVLAEEEVSGNVKQELAKIANRVEILPLPKWKIYVNLFGALFTSKPFQVHYFYQKSAHRKVEELIAEWQPDHIYCQLIRCAEYVKNIHHIPKTIDYMDALSKGIERRIDDAGIKRILFKSEFKRLMKYENLIFDYFDFHTIISEQDRQFIMHSQKRIIEIVPNGIDTDFFKPQAIKVNYDVVFVGNMSYPPNVDAVQFFVKEIVPKLMEKFPNLKVLIAGANPAKEISNLSNNHITVSGWVDDIRLSYAQSLIFVAPLRIGTGLQNKLLEAMAMGIPCVTSVLANKALNARVPEEILVCAEPYEYIQSIEMLLNDSVRRSAMSISARNFVEKEFCWKTSMKPMVDRINNQSKY